jgi:hypothetical protein
MSKRVPRKKCSRCGKAKSRSGFYKNARRSDGLASWCKDCVSEYDKARNEYYKERYATPEYRVKQAAYSKARKADPEKASHDRALQKARRSTPEGKAYSLAKCAERKAKKLEQICECCTKEEVSAAYADWVGKDCYCCKGDAEAMDHVIPISAGEPGDGLHCSDNFKPTCKSCNCAKCHLVWPRRVVGGWEWEPHENWLSFIRGRRKRNERIS